MSVPTTAAELVEWTGGRLLRSAPDSTFERTVIDSREAGPGALFVAIVGERHDAHRFLADVFAAGSAGVLVQEDRVASLRLPPETGFVVAVADTTRGLGELGRGHRQRFEGPLIGITGSNGKTTTKELCASILSRCGSTLATRGNLNNQFGVPLTLLSRAPEDRFAIVEMGMNHRGEIAGLAALAEPTIGVLTNVGTAHIEFLGSREAIAEEKGDLLAALPAAGTAVVGRDDPLAFAQAARSPAPTLSFGQHRDADLRASKLRRIDGGAFVFELESPFGRGDLRVPGLAETIVENALAAAGGAFAAGAPFEDVVAGLAEHAGVAGRMQPRPLGRDVLLIDDTYNANPQSMRNALETLAALDVAGRRFAALGEMGELGAAREEAHREAGRLAAELGLDGLFVLGDSRECVVEGARAAGLTRDRVVSAESHAEIARALSQRLGKGDCVLIKGSRAAAMEKVITALEAEEGR